MITTNMKRLWTALTVALAICCGATVNALDAGASARRMAFESGVPLAGDADRQGRAALGEHDPLWARCLYLNDGETVVYLLTVDMHHIPQALYERVVDAASDMASAESIILTATYTGNGPGGMEERLPLRWTDGRFDSTLLDQVTQSILDAMAGARDAAQRATLGYGIAKQNVLSVNASDPAGPIDERIGVIRVDNADGQAIAIVTNFAAAPRLVPTTEYYQFSADYPGAYYSALEGLSDPGCVAMFMPGACADQIPANPEHQTGWAHVESVGRLLAVRTKEVANRMSFRDARLRIHYREVTLPPTLAHTFFPSTAVIQALEIDGLLMTFLPFLPDVSVGSELNRRLSSLGYETPLTISMANGYLMDLVSHSAFTSDQPSAKRHYFGPGMAEWLYAEVEAMLQEKEVTRPEQAIMEVALSELSDNEVRKFVGSGWDRGVRRGVALGTLYRSRYEESILGAIREGSLRPAESTWKRWPALLDATPVALPALAASIRPWLSGIDADTIAALEGAAAGSNLPFDAFWLLQNTPTFLARGEDGAWFQGPVTTQLAITGDQAGADGTILGLNLDWPLEDIPTVFTVVPEEGHRFLQIGFEWQLGVLVGLNDVGVSVAITDLAVHASNSPTGPPLEFLLRDVLQYASTFDEALIRLRAATHLRDGRVLLSGRTEDGWRTALVSLDENIAIRDAEEGLLMGIDISRETAGDPTRARYESVAAQLANERIVGVEELQRLLTFGSALDEERTKVWNADTRQSVIMIPEKRLVYVAISDAAGNPMPYVTHQLEVGVPNE